MAREGWERAIGTKLQERLQGRAGQGIASTSRAKPATSESPPGTTPPGTGASQLLATLVLGVRIFISLNMCIVCREH
jgi:hypothetical protein